MNSRVKRFSREDIDFANFRLSWFLNSVLYDESVWVHFPYYKIVLGEFIAECLRKEGFWFQSSRLKNHLNLWKKKNKIGFEVDIDESRSNLSFTISKKSTLSLKKEREREVS